MHPFRRDDATSHGAKLLYTCRSLIAQNMFYKLRNWRLAGQSFAVYRPEWENCEWKLDVCIPLVLYSSNCKSYTQRLHQSTVPVGVDTNVLSLLVIFGKSISISRCPTRRGATFKALRVCICHTPPPTTSSSFCCGLPHTLVVLSSTPTHAPPACYHPPPHLCQLRVPLAKRRVCHRWRQLVATMMRVKSGGEVGNDSDLAGNQVRGG